MGSEQPVDLEQRGALRGEQDQEQHGGERGQPGVGLGALIGLILRPATASRDSDAVVDSSCAAGFWGSLHRHFGHGAHSVPRT